MVLFRFISVFRLQCNQSEHLTSCPSSAHISIYMIFDVINKWSAFISVCVWPVWMVKERQLHARQYAKKIKILLIVRPVKKYHIVGNCKSLNECVRVLDACIHDYVIENERKKSRAPTASHAGFWNVLTFKRCAWVLVRLWDWAIPFFSSVLHCSFCRRKWIC